MFKSNGACEPFTQGGGGGEGPFHTFTPEDLRTNQITRRSIHTSLFSKHLDQERQFFFLPWNVQGSGACVKGAVKGSHVRSFTCDLTAETVLLTGTIRSGYF